MELIAICKKQIEKDKIEEFRVYKDSLAYYLVKDIGKIKKMKEIDEKLYRWVLRKQKIAIIIKNYKTLFGNKGYLIVLEDGRYIAVNNIKIIKEDLDFKEKFIEHNEAIEMILDIFRKDNLALVLQAFKKRKLGSITRIDLDEDVSLYYAFKKGDILTFGYFASLVSYWASYDLVDEIKTQIDDDKQIAVLLELAKQCNKEFVTIFPRIQVFKEIAKDLNKIEIERIEKHISKYTKVEHYDIIAKYKNYVIKIEDAEEKYQRLVIEYVDEYNENVKHIITVTEDYENKDNYYITHSIIDVNKDESINVFSKSIEKEKLQEVSKIEKYIIENKDKAKEVINKEIDVDFDLEAE